MILEWFWGNFGIVFGEILKVSGAISEGFEGAKADFGVILSDFGMVFEAVWGNFWSGFGSLGGNFGGVFEFLKLILGDFKNF